jgi:hypothetical protein
MLVILATWKAEIGRIAVRGQPEQKMFVSPSSQRKTVWCGSVMGGSLK